MKKSGAYRLAYPCDIDTCVRLPVAGIAGGNKNHSGTYTPSTFVFHIPAISDRSKSFRSDPARLGVFLTAP
jgi:hypothetical protein